MKTIIEISVEKLFNTIGSFPYIIVKKHTRNYTLRIISIILCIPSVIIAFPICILILTLTSTIYIIYMIIKGVKKDIEQDKKDS